MLLENMPDYSVKSSEQQVRALMLYYYNSILV